MIKMRLFCLVLLAAVATVPVLAADAQEAPATASGFYIRPHLQNVSKDGATWIWETPQTSIGVVEFGQNGAYDKKAEETQAQTIHRVRVTGLTPETVYNYRINAGSEQQESTFKTAPATDRPITFVLIGDSRRWDQTWEETKMVEHVAQWSPEFYLTMGDLVVNGHKKDLWPEHFNRFSNVMDHLWMVTARGNHEGSQILDPDNDWFAKYHELPAPGEPYCGMEWGNTWIGLISYEATVASPKWINEELPKVNKKYKILAHHFPVYCTGYFGPEDSRKEMGTTTYKPLADACDKFEIDIDVAGHTHIYERSHPIRNGQRDDVNGTVYVVNGGDINANYPEWFTAVADDRETFAKPTYTVFHMGEDQIWFRSFAWSKKEQKIVEIDYKIIPQLEDLPKQTLVKLQGASGDALLQTIQDLGAMTVHEAAEPLLAYLENPDQAVRAAATTALRRIGLPETSEKLLAYVRDENEQVRREAARAIEIAMPEGLAGAVAQVAADESADPNVRQALLGALQLHAPAGYATEQFLAVLKKADAPEPVRQRAAYALSRTATEKEVPVLMEMFKQEASQYVTVRLAFALNSLTGRRQPLDGKAPLAQSKPGEERQPFIDKWLDATEKKAA